MGVVLEMCEGGELWSRIKMGAYSEKSTPPITPLAPPTEMLCDDTRHGAAARAMPCPLPTCASPVRRCFVVRGLKACMKHC